MSPGLRKFTLSVHMTASVGWIGAVAAYITLDIVALFGRDALPLRAAYFGMDRIASYAIVPLALATLLTGLLMALGTKWGLFRHYWTLISFLMTALATAVLLITTETIGHFATVAANPETTVNELRALGSTLVHSVGGLLILLVNMWLNVYKPQGLTPYGWKKQQEQRSLPGRDQATAGF